MRQTVTSHTVHADSSGGERRQRLTHESGFLEREEHSSPWRLALLVVIVVAVLGGATALMDDGPRPSESGNAARTANR